MAEKKKPPTGDPPEKEGRASRSPRSAKSTAAAPKKRAPRKNKAEVSAQSTTLEPTSATGSQHDIPRLLAGEHSEPHSILGAHPTTIDGEPGVVVRALIPSAARVECHLADGRVVELTREAEGLSDLYSASIAGATLPRDYR